MDDRQLVLDDKIDEPLPLLLGQVIANFGIDNQQYVWVSKQRQPAKRINLASPGDVITNRPSVGGPRVAHVLTSVATEFVHGAQSSTVCRAGGFAETAGT